MKNRKIGYTGKSLKTFKLVNTVAFFFILFTSIYSQATDSRTADSSTFKKEKRGVTFRLVTGIGFNSFRQANFFSNHLTDIRDSIFSVDTEVVAAFNTNTTNVDSLIAVQGQISQDVRSVNISIPNLGASLHIPIFSWLDVVGSTYYFFQGQEFIIDVSDPTRFIDSTTTILGYSRSIIQNFNVQSFVFGVGGRFYLPTSLIHINKTNIFIDYHYYLNSGYSSLSSSVGKIEDKRFLAPVGFSLAIGTSIRRLSSLNIGMDGVFFINSNNFCSHDTWSQLVTSSNTVREYLDQNTWSIRSIGIRIEFYWL